MTAQEFFASLGYCDTEDHEISIEEVKTARLKEYDRLSALAGKKSKV